MRVVGNHESQLNKLYRDYCLEDISFNNGDVVVDCGANVGELFTLFNRIKFKLNIMLLSHNTIFNSLKNNVVDAGIAYELALSNSNGMQKIFIDSDGANSSLSYFGIIIQ